MRWQHLVVPGRVPTGDTGMAVKERVDEMLSDLGDDEWELVTVLPIEGSDLTTYLLFLKRPLD